MREKTFARTMLLSLAALYAPIGHTQQIATSTQLIVSPLKVPFGESVMLTAIVTPATGPVSELEGLPFNSYIASGTQNLNLDRNGVAYTSFVPVPVANEQTVTAVFEEYEVGGLDYLRSSATATLTLLPANTQLQGTYVFSFQGAGYPQSIAPGTASAALGTLVADGKGNLTGELDTNSALGSSSIHVRGTYDFPFGASTGKMTLESSSGVQQYDVFVPPGAGVSSATLIQASATPVRGITKLALQSAAALSATGLIGQYAVALSGETACTDCAAEGHAAGLAASAGYLVFEIDGSCYGTFDGSIGPQFAANTNVAGQYTGPDASGRIALSLTLPGASSDEPTHYVAYIVDASHIRLLSTDTHAKSILLAGELSR